MRDFRRCKEVEELGREAQQQAIRELSWFYDSDGMLNIKARLPAEAGQMFIKAIQAASEEISMPGNSGFREIWVEAPDGKYICALINGEWGWLMYLREPGDAGFSSRNPSYDGPPNTTIEYRLANGQRDVYPASWAYPVARVERALQFFEQHHLPPPFILWHNDAEDGVCLEFKDLHEADR